MGGPERPGRRRAGPWRVRGGVVDTAVKVHEHIDRCIELLRARGRASHADLMRELGVAEPVLAQLAAELVSVRRLAVAIGGDVLLWAGDRTGEQPSALVGRAREAALLAECWAQAVAGQGQAVLIRGEAGIGKSRLARTLEAHIAGQRHRRLQAGGSAFHRNSAFHPVAGLLRCALRIGREAAGAAAFRRLEAALAALGMADAAAPAIFASLLGVPVAEGGGLDPGWTRERERAETLRLLAQLFVRLAAAEPLLLLVEDLHWVDASSLELLEHLVEAAAPARMLIVLTARPDFDPRWAERRGVGTIELARLGRPQVERLVSAIAGGRPVPAASRARIFAGSGGVPLFVQELTRMHLDSEGARDDGRAIRRPGSGGIPDSLFGRLERLPAGRETAQLASVIGEHFTYAMLAAVAEADEAELRRDLAALVEAGLLFAQGDPPEATYAFRHALVQDAAYRTLPRITRLAHHGRVADALERQGGSEPELLAHHHAEAGRAADAVRYRQLAGAEAVRRLAYVEAIGHLGSALRSLQELPVSRDRDRQELALRAAMGVPLVAARGYGAPEVEDCYMRAYDLSLGLDDRDRRFSAARGLWNLRLARAELDQARALGERLLELAAADRDPGRHVAAHRTMGVTLFALGEFVAAAGHFRAAIAAYDPGLHAALAPEHGADPCVVCMAYLGTTTWALGYPDQALRHVEEGLALARRLGHDLSIAVALTTAGRFHQVRREPERTREHATAVIALSEELGLPYWRALGGTLHGWAMAREGNPQGGIVAIQRGRKALRETGAALVEPWNLAALADAHRSAGDLGTALGLLAESLATADTTGERWWQAEQLRLTGQCTLERGGPSAEAEAEACFERAMAVARSQQARTLELRAATSRARLLGRTGRGGEARAALADVYGWFTEGFETPDLREARAALFSLP